MNEETTKETVNTKHTQDAERTTQGAADTKSAEKTKSRKGLWIGGGVIVLLIAVFAALFALFSPKTSAGKKAITVTVVDDNAVETTYSANTDAAYLAEVFDEVEGLDVEGTMGDYGLYIETVNGLTADYEKDGAYWSIYVNGEYGQYGADKQPVTDGDSYSLKYETANAD